MISDFGLSKIGPTNQLISCVYASVKGTFGYLDPEFFRTRQLTRKTDVYAFGVVLFELLSGREAVDQQNEEEQSLVMWAQKWTKGRKFYKIVDPNIKGTISTICLTRFAQLADRCVHPDLKQRPTMTEVVGSLQTILELQEKSKHSSESSSIMSFPWKYFVHTSKQNSDKSGTSSPMSLENNMDQHVELVIPDHIKTFTYDELKLATRDFGDDTSLGGESYGKVYKGWIDKTTYSPCKEDTGLPVAVKKLDSYKLSNLEMLKEYCHPNLVKLIGCCLEGGSLFLVYEFMSKGNFEDLLRSGAVARLPLVTKVKIAAAIARGIAFLQKPELNQTWPTLCESELYRDKILLDEDFTAKLSDYDVTYIVNGRYDIASPDYDGLELVLQSDLSGYEVVFIEVLTGERVYKSNIVKIDRFFLRHGKESLHHIANLCFAICNEVDAEKKMVTMLKEHDKLIRRRLKMWLSDPKNQDN
ncbi:putative serine/threonine-protein kinase PBL10 [Bidens hawaiensis]|uniref:putative serine/threonine-protein kinase PBL10 n=1 Tax=Bidens hawaiensis TaxID=980011 RepID=UPI0040494F55